MVTVYLVQIWSKMGQNIYLRNRSTDSCNSKFIWKLLASSCTMSWSFCLFGPNLGQNGPKYSEILAKISCGSHISATVRLILAIQSSYEGSWPVVVQRHGHFVHLVLSWPKMGQNAYLCNRLTDSCNSGFIWKLLASSCTSWSLCLLGSNLAQYGPKYEV